MVPCCAFGKCLLSPQAAVAAGRRENRNCLVPQPGGVIALNKTAATAAYAALRNLPASLIVGAPHACPDPDSQSNDSQFLKYFRKKMKCGRRINHACRCLTPALFPNGAITRELRLQLFA